VRFSSLVKFAEVNGRRVRFLAHVMGEVAGKIIIS
jgi:hypothetical protein